MKIIAGIPLSLDWRTVSAEAELQRGEGGADEI